MVYWHAEGQNRFADGKPWNNFAAPQGVHQWDALLPAQDHYLLNDRGRCYHLVGPSNPWWVRFAQRVQLMPGTYRLILDMWGDWVDLVDGRKQAKPDPGHARVELFLGERGREVWLRPTYNGPNKLQAEFTVEEAGEYELGFGILTVFAAGGSPGANGCFLRSFGVERVESATRPQAVESTDRPDVTPPVLKNKRVIAPAGLWLRSGPSVDHDQLHRLPEGTVVEVLAEGVWDQVRVLGVVGYVSSQYLGPA